MSSYKQGYYYLTNITSTVPYLNFKEYCPTHERTGCHICTKNKTLFSWLHSNSTTLTPAEFGCENPAVVARLPTKVQHLVSNKATLTAWILTRHGIFAPNLNSDDGLHGYFGSWNADGMRWQIDGFQHPESTFWCYVDVAGGVTLEGGGWGSTWWYWYGGTYGHTAPLAPVSRQAFRRPAGLLAECALWVAWKITFPPVVLMVYVWQLLSRKICSVFLAIGNSEILTFGVYVVLAYWKRVDGVV